LASGFTAIDKTSNNATFFPHTLKHITELISFQHYKIKWLEVPTSYFANKNKLQKENITSGIISTQLNLIRGLKAAKNNLIELYQNWTYFSVVVRMTLKWF